MRTFAQKPKTIQRTKAAQSTKPILPLSGQSRDVHSILQVQRAIGNRAVQQLLKPNAEELQAGSATTASTPFGHDFSRIPIFSPSPIQVQPKLTVSVPGDMYEQEADRVADQVMRMPEPKLQRNCPCCGVCPKCAEEERLQRKPHTPPITPMIQRQDEDQEDELHQGKTTSAFTPTVTPRVSANINAMRVGGQPLSPSVRVFFGPRFGADFGNVRVHRDSRAAEAARAVHAKAFAVGRDLVFGSGQFAPETSTGKRLLAHELAHVAQQAPVTISTAVKPWEYYRRGGWL